MRFIILCLLLIVIETQPPQLPPGIRLSKTTKGNEIVIFNGFEMRKKDTIAEGTVQVYVCVKHSCSGRAHAPINTYNLVERTPHNHEPNPTDIIVRERKEQIKEQARTRPDTAARQIVAESRAGLSDEQIMMMPSSSAAQRNIHRQRLIPGAGNVDAETLETIIFEGDFQLDKDGNQFLLHDSRNADGNLPIFFIFANQHGLNRLKNYPHWSGDGTFKVSPLNLMQLYTINILVEHSSVPAVYILMQNKDRETYRRMFNIIRNSIADNVPQSFMMDFEQAAKLAILDIFPAVQIRHCLFHLSQESF